jgi:hypothetical protein
MAFIVTYERGSFAVSDLSYNLNVPDSNTIVFLSPLRQMPRYLKLATTTSFYILSNTSLINHPITRYHVVYAVDILLQTINKYIHA